MMEEWDNQRTVFNGRVFEVRSGDVWLSAGGRAQRDVVVHNGGVTIAAVVDGAVLMIQQFRVAIGEHLIELPAGMIEGREDPAGRALKELAEETGYRAKRVELIADYFVSPGYTTERMRIYQAHDLTFVGQSLDSDEQIEVIRVSLAEAAAMLENGRFRDAKTIIGLYTLLSRLDG